MRMNVELVEKLAKLRIIIGYLGEREQFGWWQSSFFTQGSSAFLAPLFSRTQVLAQCSGVTQAAALIHDERIGVGSVYHLFRLPEDMEQAIHKTLRETILPDAVKNKEAALNDLRKFASKPDNGSEGPVLLGAKSSLLELSSWQNVCGLYLEAFDRGIKIYPYFAENS